MRISFRFILLAIVAWAGIGCRTMRTEPSVPSVFTLDETTRGRFQEAFYAGLKAQVLGDYVRALEYFKKASILNPTSGATHYQLARLYLRTNNLDAAYRHARWAARFDKDNPYYLELLGNLEKEKGDLKAAEKIFEQLVRQYPDRLDYYNALLQLALQREDFSGALSVITRAEKQFGTTPAIQHRKLSLYLLLGQDDSAEHVAYRLLKKQPDDAEALQKLTALLLRRGDTTRAIAVMKEMLQQHPDGGRFKLELAKLYILSDRKDSVLGLLDALAADRTVPPDAKFDFLIRYVLPFLARDTGRQYLPLIRKFVRHHPRDGRYYAAAADFYFNRGMEDSAYAMYCRAVQLRPNFFPIWIRLIEMDLDRKAYDSVVSRAEEALEYFPAQPVLYFYKGVALNQLKRYADALSILEEGLLYVPLENAALKKTFYTQLAEAAYRLGDVQKAYDYFEKALAIDPNDPVVLNNYAYYLSVEGQNLDKALKMSKKSLKLEPDQPAYLDTYGWILYKKGQFEKAREYVEKALQKQPTDPELLEHMGDIFNALGQQAAAIEYWKKAIKYGGDQSKLQSRIAKARP